MTPFSILSLNCNRNLLAALTQFRTHTEKTKTNQNHRGRLGNSGAGIVIHHQV